MPRIQTVPPLPSTTSTPLGPSGLIEQDTPDLGGVVTVWILGILGTLGILGYSWWSSRP